jgi:hypothetical protein
MEFNIDQNRKRSESLSHDCYSLFLSTEVLAFDLISTSYLMGQFPAPQFYQFLEQCIRPGYALSTGSEADFAQAAQHVKSLQGVITRCAADLLQPDVRPPDIPRRTSEFVVYLKDQKMRLDKELNRLPPVMPDADPLETVAFLDDPNPSDLPAGFSRWLLSELKVGGHPNDESLELRSLVRSVAHRLAAISHLHASIRRMKQDVLDPDELDHTDCDPADILSSPFVVGLKNACAFLASAYSALQTQQELIPKCCESLGKCRARLADVMSGSRAAVAEIERHIAQMQEALAQRRREADDLKRRLQGYIDILRTKPNFPALPDISRYEELETKLRKELAEPTRPGVAMEDVTGHIAIVVEIKEKLREINRLYEEKAALIAQIVGKDEAMLAFHMAECRGDEENRMQQREIDLIEKYEEGLKDLLDSLKFSEMGAWCDELGEIGANFAALAKKQEAVIADLRKATHVEGMKAQIEAKRKQIEDLSALNGRLSEEIAREELVLHGLREVEFRARHTPEQFRVSLPPYVNPEDERAVRQYRRKMTCPKCQFNRRDCVLSRCGHTMCRSCLSALSVKKCPICGDSFTDAAVRPFFYQ